MKIGILAIQGSVEEHRRALARACTTLHLSCEIISVRTPQDMTDAHGKVIISGIILPGGESTAQSLLLKNTGLFETLKSAIGAGLPVWGTCAGAILMAKKVKGKNPPDTLQVMDIEADRNAYGTQLDSFDELITIHFPETEQTVSTVFIRAPKLTPISKSVYVFATLHGKAVGFVQGHMLATEFHPELSSSTACHEYFLKMCRGKIS